MSVCLLCVLKVVTCANSTLPLASQDRLTGFPVPGLAGERPVCCLFEPLELSFVLQDTLVAASLE